MLMNVRTARCARQAEDRGSSPRSRSNCFGVSLYFFAPHSRCPLLGLRPRSHHSSANPRQNSSARYDLPRRFLNVVAFLSHTDRVISAPARIVAVSARGEDIFVEPRHPLSSDSACAPLKSDACRASPGGRWRHCPLGRRICVYRTIDSARSCFSSKKVCLERGDTVVPEPPTDVYVPF